METAEMNTNPNIKEEVWATLDRIAKRQEEYDKKHKEWQEEYDKRQKERQEEYDKKQEVWREEAAKRRAEYEKREAEAAKKEEKRRAEYEKREAEYAKRQAAFAKWEEREARRLAKAKQETEKSRKELHRIIGRLGNRMGDWVVYMVMPNLLVRFNELGWEFTSAFAGQNVISKCNLVVSDVDIVLQNGEYVMAVEVKSKPSTSDVWEHLERMEKLRVDAEQHNDKRFYMGAIAGMIVADKPKAYALESGLYVVEPSGDTFSITVPEGENSPRKWYPLVGD